MVPSSFSDPDIIEQLKKKDKLTWEQFYFSIAPKLKAFILKKVIDFKANWDVSSVTEDIVQSTIVKSFKNIHQYNPEKSALETWVFTIAKNTFIDCTRKLQDDKKIIENCITEYNSTPEKLCSVEELCSKMKLDINNFTKKQLAYLDMFFIQQWSDQLIADEVGVSTNAVVKARSRLLAEIRSLLLKNSA